MENHQVMQDFVHPQYVGIVPSTFTQPRLLSAPLLQNYLSVPFCLCDSAQCLFDAAIYWGRGKEGEGPKNKQVSVSG